MRFSYILGLNMPTYMCINSNMLDDAYIGIELYVYDAT